MNHIFLASLLVSISPVLVACESSCPTDVEIYPCNCRHRGRLTKVECPKTVQVDELMADLKKMSEVRLIVYKIEIRSDNLTSIPANIFKNALIIEAIFKTINLVSISNDAFLGQEYSLERIEFFSTKLTVPPSISLNPLMKLNHFAMIKNTQLKIVDENFYKTLSKDNKLETLDFSGNGLERVGLDVENFFPRLRFLFLENNKIDTLKISLPADTIVEKIYLSDNMLSVIPLVLLQTMPARSELGLQRNQISDVYEDELQTAMNRFITVKLLGNAISCGCNLRWILAYTQKSNFPFVCRCSNPKNMRRYFLTSLRKKSFKWCPTATTRRPVSSSLV